jgi:hypothetical protein
MPTRCSRAAGGGNVPPGQARQISGPAAPKDRPLTSAEKRWAAATRKALAYQISPGGQVTADPRTGSHRSRPAVWTARARRACARSSTPSPRSRTSAPCGAQYDQIASALRSTPALRTTSRMIFSYMKMLDPTFGCAGRGIRDGTERRGRRPIAFATCLQPRAQRPAAERRPAQARCFTRRKPGLPLAARHLQRARNAQFQGYARDNGLRAPTASPTGTRM